jgi:TldD protein
MLAERKLMKEIAGWALETARVRGATLTEVRIVHERNRALATKNGKIGNAQDAETIGAGIRVLADGAWGFSATQDLSREGMQRCAAHALDIAKASARVKTQNVRLAAEPPAKVDWSSPCAIDPFATAVEQNIELMLKIDGILRGVQGITLAETNMNFRRYEQWFYSSEGSEIHQTRTVTGAGYAVYSFEGTEIQKRSYPNSFGGQWMNRGYELVGELKLEENAQRIAEECVALHKAEQCPQKVGTLILDSSQLGLQIHESVGHPIELDRVLGMEANFAGTSFLTLEKLNNLRYGSDLVNVVADATEGHGPGLGTFAYDDEGVQAQSVPIIQQGQFVGYLSSRDTAAMIGRERSGGNMRAEGWNRVPIVRMTNISIKPGENDMGLEDLIADTDDGVLLQTNRSWSIDDKRYNFQFSCELGWEIKKGKRTRMLKNPSYSGITTEFWNSMDAICGKREWTLWGTPNCGKGQPQQVMGTGHGASPARFRNVKIGTAFSGSD